jgi:DNA-binding LacI/PurR family transcriptional regulator
MGYDDQELARYTHPPLTSLVLPNYEMGRRAADLLIDLAVHEKAGAALADNFRTRISTTSLKLTRQSAPTLS